MADTNKIKKLIEIQLKTTGFTQSVQNVRAVQNELSKLTKGMDLLRKSPKELDKAIENATKSYVKNMEKQVKATKKVEGSVKGVTKSLGGYAKQLAALGGVTSFTQMWREGLKEISSYNDQLQDLGASTAKYGIGVSSLEQQLKSMSTQLVLTRKDTMGLFKEYEKGFRAFSMAGFESIAENLRKATGPNAEAMGGLMSSIGSVVDKMPDLQVAFENLGSGNTERIRQATELGVLLGNISVQEMKAVHTYLSGAEQISQADITRRAEIERQQEATQEYARHWERVQLLVGRQIVMPIFQEITKFLEANADDVEAFFKEIGTYVKQGAAYIGGWVDNFSLFKAELIDTYKQMSGVIETMEEWGLLSWNPYEAIVKFTAKVTESIPGLKEVSGVFKSIGDFMGDYSPVNLFSSGGLTDHAAAADAMSKNWAKMEAERDAKSGIKRKATAKADVDAMLKKAFSGRDSDKIGLAVRNAQNEAKKNMLDPKSIQQSMQRVAEGRAAFEVAKQKALMPLGGSSGVEEHQGNISANIKDMESAVAILKGEQDNLTDSTKEENKARDESMADLKNRIKKEKEILTTHKKAVAAAMKGVKTEKEELAVANAIHQVNMSQYGVQQDLLKIVQERRTAEGSMLDGIISKMQVMGQVNQNVLLQQMDKIVDAAKAEKDQLSFIIGLNEQIRQGGAKEVAAKEKLNKIIKEDVKFSEKYHDIVQEVLKGENKNLELKTARLKIDKDLSSQANKLTSAYSSQKQLLSAQTGLYSSLVSLADNFAIGVGASAKMRMQAFHGMGKEIANLEKERNLQISIMKKMEVGSSGAIEQKTQLLNIEKDIVAKQQEQAGMVKSLRDGWISAISAMNTGAGRFTKIMISGQKNLSSGVRQFGILASSVSGSSKGGYGTSERFSGLSAGKIVGAKTSPAYRTHLGAEADFGAYGAEKGLRENVRTMGQNLQNRARTTAPGAAGGISVAANPHLRGVHVAKASGVGIDTNRGGGSPAGGGGGGRPAVNARFGNLNVNVQGVDLKNIDQHIGQAVWTAVAEMSSWGLTVGGMESGRMIP